MINDFIHRKQVYVISISLIRFVLSVGIMFMRVIKFDGITAMGNLKNRKTLGLLGQILNFS